jgi:hypothetical protein
LLREGEVLRQVGVSAELFDDHSPLHLGADGQYQGIAFSLVGRLQYRSAEGTWNEWFALFQREDGRERPAWLSEDNGAYVLSFDQPALADAPALASLRPGQRLALGGQGWSVASVVRASLIAAQGELPRPPRLQGEFTVADLRNERNEVGTLDDGQAQASSPPSGEAARSDRSGGSTQWAVGRAVTLAGLQMKGLREGPAEASLAGRSLPCPSCGAALQPTLASTLAISCPQCKAVVDISQGAGADLAHYAQNNSGPAGLESQIPIGSTGRLSVAGAPADDWQVVGYQERCDLPGPGDDEQTFWREYLLYNRRLGFAFLVDTEEGWSVVRPLTGAPTTATNMAQWQGQRFDLRAAYTAKVTWVQGEFYWKVQREERARVSDYIGPRGALLSREETGTEVVWSLGAPIKSDEVVRAFRLPAEAANQLRRDAGPLSGVGRSLGSLGGMRDVSLETLRPVIILALVVIFLIVLTRCGDRDECAQQEAAFGKDSAEYQQCARNHRSGGYGGGWGGSYGGYSSGGGGHK